MIYYISKEDTTQQVVIITDGEPDFNKKFIHLKKLYQILDADKRYLVNIFDIDKKETYFYPQANGTFLFSLDNVQDIIGLDSLPDIEVINLEEYKLKIKTAEPLME